MAIVVREARPDEYAALGEIVVEAYRAIGALEGEEEYADELCDVTARAASAVVLAAEDPDAGRLVGCVTYVPGPGSPLAEEIGPGEASIRMLGVDPAAAGRGAGTALVEACVERARADGFRRVVLHSQPVMEGAQRIYVRLGFRHVPERDWVPLPHIELRCYVLDLDAGQMRASPSAEGPPADPRARSHCSSRPRAVALPPGPTMAGMSRLAPRLTIGFKTSPVGVDLETLDATWRLAGALDAFDVGWVNDHLGDSNLERGGASLEPMTLLASLAHHVPGKWLGTAVLSNTFRHPSMLAKEATVIDNLAGGRLILGLGAGWHAGEHETFGIPLPPPTERFDRLESTLRVLRALFSDAARRQPGVDLDDAFVPLRGATNEPATIRAGGPLLWLGVGRPRGIELAARYADGWPMPGNMPGDVAYFTARRDEIRRALEAVGRDPDDFSFAGQVVAGVDAVARREALGAAEAFVAAGADHVIVGIAPTGGPAALDAAAREVAEPLRARFG